MGERGSAPIEFAAGTVLLLIPVLVLIASFAPVLERRVLARSLAADIGRTVALSGGLSDVDRARMESGMVETDSGFDAVLVALCGQGFVTIERLEGCDVDDVVEVTVRVSVGHLVDVVEHTHREPVPRFRSRP